MQPSFHYLLMATQAVLQKKLFGHIKETGLTLGQPKVLDYLKEHDGTNQKELAFGCHIEPPSLTSVLNRMEEKGLIERRTLNGNHRTFYIFLTEVGKEAQLSVEDAFVALEQTAFNDISEEEQLQFMNIFKKIYGNLNPKES